MDYSAAGRGPVARARNHDIVSSGKRRPDRLEGLSSHDDCVPQGEPLKASQVLGQPPGHGVVAADGAVPGQGGDEGEVAHRAIVLKVVELSPGLRRRNQKGRPWIRCHRKPASWSSTTIPRTGWPWRRCWCPRD